MSDKENGPAVVLVTRSVVVWVVSDDALGLRSNQYSVILLKSKSFIHYCCLLLKVNQDLLGRSLGIKLEPLLFVCNLNGLEEFYQLSIFPFCE